MRKPLLLILTLALCSPLLAEPSPDGEAALKQWFAAAGRIQSVQAEFSQERTLSSMRSALKRPGKIWMDKSGLFRWQVGEPAVTTVVRDKSGRLTVLDAKGKTAKVWTKEQLLANEQEGKGQGFAMLQSMQSPTLEDFESRFRIKDATQDKERPDWWKFDLSLKDNRASVAVRQIQLTVDVKQGTLVSLVILMRDNSSMATYVKNHRLNQNLDASIFTVDTTGYKVETSP